MDTTTAMIAVNICINLFMLIDRITARIKKCKSGCCETEQERGDEEKATTSVFNKSE